MDLQQQIESKQNFINLLGLICKEYKLDPTISINIINVKAFLNPLQKEVNKAIVKQYGKMVEANRRSLPEDMDATRRYLLKTIKTPGNEAVNASYKDSFGNKETFDGVGSILNLSEPQRLEVIKYLNYSSLFRDEYILVDSRYQNTVNPDPTKLTFALITSTKTKSDDGDIVEVEVFPFTIPYKPVYATFYNKITLTINEWAANSYEAYEGGQFHFGFVIDRIDNNLIYLNPINSTFSFSKPFYDWFWCSSSKDFFDPDRMYPSQIDYTNRYGMLTFQTPHNVVTGDLIYITEFSTPDPAADVSIISEVNRPEGHTIVKKDNYSFIINVDLSSIRREVPVNNGTYPIDIFQQKALVYFASKRIQIQIRLKYLTTYAI
ncbi:hypothetical protein GQ600_27406 [Phytophthora cactorum]|nr:hypothetical protein GQ600_27406 [Phytophthora cactorum]